jgi:hypothetical protein
MLPAAHVILHLSFCSHVARLGPETTVPIRVRLADRTGRVQLDRTYRVERGDGSEAVVEFDGNYGIYRLDVAVPKYGCSASDFLTFIPGHTRSVTEQLDVSPPSPEVPDILSGTAPQSMLYANPTFVLFDKSAVACGRPIAAPLPSHITVENDQDAYYAWLYNDDTRRAPDSEVLALRLQTPTHQHHYVRIPIPFPMPAKVWPNSIQLNVSDDMMDGLATEPVDTLLCPKMWRTSAG